MLKAQKAKNKNRPFVNLQEVHKYAILIKSNRKPHPNVDEALKKW